MLYPTPKGTFVAMILNTQVKKILLITTLVPPTTTRATLTVLGPDGFAADKKKTLKQFEL